LFTDIKKYLYDEGLGLGLVVSLL